MASSTFFLESTHLQVPVCAFTAANCWALKPALATCDLSTCLSAVQDSAVLLGRTPALRILCL